MCFSMAWLQQLLSVDHEFLTNLLKLVIPLVLNQFGVAGGVLAQIINIVLWAVILIFVIIIAFGLIQCLMGSGGFSMMPRR